MRVSCFLWRLCWSDASLERMRGVSRSRPQGEAARVVAVWILKFRIVRSRPGSSKVHSAVKKKTSKVIKHWRWSAKTEGLFFTIVTRVDSFLHGLHYCNCSCNYYSWLNRGCCRCVFSYNLFTSLPFGHIYSFLLSFLLLPNKENLINKDFWIIYIEWNRFE